MLSFDDPRWPDLRGGYKVPFDARPFLQDVLAQKADDSTWETLWNELNHQGDVGEASYAAVPWLAESIRRAKRIEWNAVDMIAVIEVQRPRLKNPTVPTFLADSYHQTISGMLELLANHPDRDWNENLLPSAMALMAISRGHRRLAEALLDATPDALRRWIAYDMELDERNPSHAAELDDFFS